MILAALDPGSHTSALVIVRHEPGHPLALLFSRVYPVGRDVVLSVPIVHPATEKRKAWTETKRHEVTREDEREIAQEIATDCARHGVDEIALEAVNYVHGKTPQEVSNTAHYIAIAERILAGVGYAFGALSIKCHHVIRNAWFSALRRHCTATPGLPSLPLKIGKAGRPLDVLLRLYLAALPRTGADIRDAGCLLISHVLPDLPLPAPPPVAIARPPCPRQSKIRRRADLRPEVLDAVRAYERSGSKAGEARAALGCICPVKRGRHPSGCPAHRPKAPPVAPAGYRGIRAL